MLKQTPAVALKKMTRFSLCVLNISKMKYLGLLWMFLLFSNATSAQHIIYLTDGAKMPGKITEITAHKAKFKNLEDLTGPTYNRAIDDILFAFNASGDYIVFSKEQPLTKKEREDFVNPAIKALVADVLVDTNGNVSATNIASENETELVCTVKGKKAKITKSSLCFIVRRNGSHEVFVASKQALPILVSTKALVINALLGTAATAVATTKADKGLPAQEVKLIANKPADSVIDYPDKELFKNKSLEKTKEFTTYTKAITAVNTNNAAAKKAINLACALFADEGSRVEVSSVNNAINNKYPIRDYLNRLMLRSGQFDKVQIEYATINYVSQFVKGADGNFHGTVSFVQTFKGFVDNKVVYGDVTKRTVNVTIKPYQKAINGESVLAWDVLLGDIGVVETKKI